LSACSGFHETVMALMDESCSKRYYRRYRNSNNEFSNKRKPSRFRGREMELTLTARGVNCEAANAIRMLVLQPLIR